MFLVNTTEIEEDLRERNSQGGAAFVPEDFSIPKCKLCDEEMCLFFQFEIRTEYMLPFSSGSQVAIFMCPFHNDIPEAPTVMEGQNPEEYKEQSPGHYKLLMFPPVSNLVPKEPKNKHIAGRRLTFTSSEETLKDFGTGIKSGLEAFKVGGQPSWINFCSNSQCSCGADMAFICQLPENYGFQRSKGAPEQPDSFSHDEYCLFLGNIVFIFGCTNSCSPTSLIAECDN